ncbi:hypothetical protein T484DRAFT_2595136 [Baffinella frigidus]|nr:hypothetical protein T484DRAFT_2595136 [Cryptophyta sp. CCMP2293]
MHKLSVKGRHSDQHLAKINAACEHLQRTQQTFTFESLGLIEADFESTVREEVNGQRGKARDHLRLHGGSPLVMCNGAYIGSIREFEAWALTRYGYQDKTIDSLYNARARKALQKYMVDNAAKYDFMYLDLGMKNEAGDVVELKPRVTIQLYRDLLPKTCENFTSLCEGAYNGCLFHRVVPKGWVQAGAVGDESIYGGVFEDESFALKHRGAGDVAMASSSVHANASQFYISLDSLAHLDGKKVIFGRVVDGMKAVRQVGTVSGDRAMNLKATTAGKAATGPKADGESAKPLAPESSEETAVSPAGEPLQTVSANDGQDEAERAAAKIGHAGKGFILKRRAKKMKTASFSSTISDASPEEIWGIIGDFAAKSLVSASVYKSVDVTGGMKIGASRKVTTFTDEERSETLVTLNSTKMWLSYTESGHGKEDSKCVECTSTWKVKPEGGTTTVKLDVKFVLKDEEATGDDLTPLWEDLFNSVLKTCSPAAAAGGGAPAAEEVGPKPQTLNPGYGRWDTQHGTSNLKPVQRNRGLGVRGYGLGVRKLETCSPAAAAGGGGARCRRG